MAISPNGARLMVWEIVFAVVTTLMMGLRLWAIRIRRSSIQMHDYFVFIAYLSTCCMEGVCFWAIANGLGAHTDTLTSYEIGVQYQLFISTYVTWTTGTVCCKFSMLALYTSLFPSKRFRYAVWVMYGAVFVYYVFFLSFFMTQCHPISYGWNPVPGGYCKSVMLEEILSIALNMGLDTVIALLPMPLLWKVQMPFRNKLTISVMFAMGLFVVGVMAWRMAITLMPSTQTDFVHGLYLVGLVSFMELWFSMIIVSLPTVAPLFRRYVEPFYKTLTGRSNSNTNPRRLKEAQHTIGSEPGQAKRSKSWQLEDGYLELDDTESGSKGHAEAWSGMSRASLIDASENTPSHAITK
ncbi:hypothetical protein AAWM_06691 [Aspergillus awamori]|uniref:Contig An04c0120, genomic contig n=5 Tax=Aspergillus TaxID=5052 RepID=A2QIC0_ASPNC|nr:uncharacterized protein An04g02990 [Aspergillus niger]XP_026632563.1 hypothetical protein BDQ94DRAFT_165248 [Aspergillus welwitschiae]RDK47207.1 hypothetical protein M752DRAFT_289319 [Aspergillus phoenicis ATCC 13157]GCB23806.1 hypothetical protein AAWM_06691 [Aspergillus awamori]KAI2812430.1 hypothetical protein CBS115989_10441 [Aspergillus niger]KAI2836003.1 hypothetical protein CBS11232_10329 [Aspergillus niger]KAI2868064.1 hypothetical protein CBS115988_10942 [Aspergillus niger]|eukprot:XP_001401666.1 hypothetical protein ANI_1_1714184 [Aspergillus niger CBS 513.88]